MEKEKIYLDTSVPSAYYDNREPFRMELTRAWWKEELNKYEVFISAVTKTEIGRTQDEEKKRQLLELIKDFFVLDITKEVEDLAEGYIKQGIISRTYAPDALHIAIVSTNKIDYLVTWNIRHLAGIHKGKRIKLFNTSAGIFVPEIVTPEFFGEEE